VMETFGVTPERSGPLEFQIRSCAYRPRDFRIEGDHSSASYFLAAAAVAGGRVRVEGLDPGSRQPDARLGRILAESGCTVGIGEDWIEVEGTGSLSPFDLDMAEAPDLVPTLAVLALFASGACRMRGIAHLRLKESDRLQVLAGNLRALGGEASVEGDALVVAPSTTELRGVRISTASDHRIAMAFAVAGLRIEDLYLDDAECVAKSNPTFWKEFGRLEGS